MATIPYETFSETEIRCGTVIAARIHPTARVPAYLLDIDFGPLGRLASSARITDLYTPESLVGRQVLAVTNLAPRQIGSHRSECLVLGFYSGGIEGEGPVVLAVPDRPLPDGSRLL